MLYVMLFCEYPFERAEDRDPATRFQKVLPSCQRAVGLLVLAVGLLELVVGALYLVVGSLERVIGLLELVVGLLS